MNQHPAPAPPGHRDPPWPDHGPDWRHDAGSPEEAFPVPFNAFDALAMVLWSIFAQVLVGSLANSLGLLPGGATLEDPVPALAVQIVAQVVTLVGLIAYLGLRGVLSWRIWGPVRPAGRHVAIGAGLGVTAVLLVQFVTVAVDELFGPYEAPEQFALQASTDSVVVLLLAAVTAVFLAPVIEELVFRSLLFQSVRRKLGLMAGMVTSALVFAFVHTELLFRVVDDALVWAPNPPGLVGLVVLALWLAGMFHLTGSLVVPIMAHATYNATILLLQAILVQDVGAWI